MEGFLFSQTRIHEILLIFKQTKTLSMGWIIFIGSFVLLFIAILWSTYNKLIRAEN